MKKIAILPTLLTLGNAVCGFAAIASATKATDAEPMYFAMSGWLIFAAMVFDALDGYAARISRTASKFGGELDSLCDAVSFGVAPALLVMRMGPSWDHHQLHQVLACIATLYMLCAILRLARYNVESTPDSNVNKKFRGLPSPGAAGCLASLAIMRADIDKWSAFGFSIQHIEAWATLGALAIALLMVSKFPYPHLTKQILKGRRHFRHLIQVILGVLIIVAVKELALVMLFWVYALGIPLRHTLVRSFRKEAQPATAPASPGGDENVIG